MTNAELLAKIKAEIERQMKFYDEKETKAWDDSEQGDEDALWYQGHRKMCAKLLSFVSTLESEKPMNPDGLEEELERFIASGKSVTVDDYGTYKVSYHDFKKVARHFAKWGMEQASGSSEIPNDLEEAAGKSAITTYKMPEDGDFEKANKTLEARVFHEIGFKAGAKWDKEQMMKSPLVSIGNTASEELQRINYENGKKDMKEQMMKEAVEGEVVKDINNKFAVTAKINLDGFKFGDKVRVIVLPKEDEK